MSDRSLPTRQESAGVSAICPTWSLVDRYRRRRTIFPERPWSPMPIATPEELRQHLALAMRVELTTVPPYL